MLRLRVPKFGHSRLSEFVVASAFAQPGLMTSGRDHDLARMGDLRQVRGEQQGRSDRLSRLLRGDRLGGKAAIGRRRRHRLYPAWVYELDKRDPALADIAREALVARDHLSRRVPEALERPEIAGADRILDGIKEGLVRDLRRAKRCARIYEDAAVLGERRLPRGTT